MADNHSSSAHVKAFEAFSWLNKDVRSYPMAKFVTEAHDMGHGIASVLEMLEDYMLRDVNGEPQILSATQHGALLRFAIVSAKALQHEAAHCVDWLNEHGARAAGQGEALATR
jgi:hypothetical protein